MDVGITQYLVSPKGANRKRKRRGRGAASGHGGTSCRGNKGQGARGMTKKTKGFEGGQMPLIRRLPKRGFSNKAFNRMRYQIVNLIQLKSFSGDVQITPQVLKEKGLIKDASSLVKILGQGPMKNKIDIEAHAFSAKAKATIEENGGKVVLIKPTAQ